MPRLSRRYSIPLAIVIAAAAAPALTGCFGNPIENIVNNGVEQAVEGATGQDVSLGGKLPDGWPAEVPVVEGEIGPGGGTTGADSGWAVLITSSVADPLAEAKASLEAAGFTADSNFAGAEGGIIAFTNGTYQVVVVGSPEGLLYTVTPATAP